MLGLLQLSIHTLNRINKEKTEIVNYDWVIIVKMSRILHEMNVEVRLDLEDFIKQLAEFPLLDVRSPSEFENGHIPGAISLPLFTDEERAEIGTIYKNISKKEAIKRGLEFTAPKMIQFVEFAESLGFTGLNIYCWRGGMRSGSMAWLLNTYGIKSFVLEGGYKTYRRAVLNFFEQKLPLQVITGFTGSQKTALLLMMKEKGEQVIDLEGLAGHQGSSFGNQKSESQPTTEYFQNLVYEEFKTMDLNRPIWIEDESMHIGRVSLVESLYAQKNTSPHFFIEVEKTERVEFLLKDYGVLTDRQLIDATSAISKKLGKEYAEMAENFINQGNRRQAAEIILTYYDKRYSKSLLKKGEYIEWHKHIKMNQLEAIADELSTQKIHEL